MGVVDNATKIPFEYPPPSKRDLEITRKEYGAPAAMPLSIRSDAGGC